VQVGVYLYYSYRSIQNGLFDSALPNPVELRGLKVGRNTANLFRVKASYFSSLSPSLRGHTKVPKWKFCPKRTVHFRLTRRTDSPALATNCYACLRVLFGAFRGRNATGASKGRDCSSGFGLRLLAFYRMAVCGQNYRQHRQRTCKSGREIVMQESGVATRRGSAS